MEISRIRKKKYYAVSVKLASPLCISSGYDENTDKDVLRNACKEVFLPGSSIAGAWRDYLGQSRNCDGLMGFSEDEKGRMSPIIVQDLYLSENIRISARDGVKLDSSKGVINKFDMEIVETGASGILFFNYTERDNTQWDYETAIADILRGMQTGEIRFGASKNRGMGRLHIDCVYESAFTKEEVDAWIRFSPERKSLSAYQKHVPYREWAEKHIATRDSRYIHITVPLTLHGGISIRKYSTKPRQADYEHITSNGEPVIPGSSWGGAIRSDACRILEDLGCHDMERLVRAWFGSIDDDLKKKVSDLEMPEDESPEEAHQSQIVIGESILRGAQPVPMTRNKINRFDASTVDGALYSDISYYGGETELNLMVRKDADAEYEALLGLLLIIISDLQEGYLPVGGLVSVGRGIFEAGIDPVKYSETIHEDRCMSKLYSLL